MSDSIRWYDRESLEIQDQVSSADGKKMVKADIRHAKKLGLLPSVTSILDGVLTKGDVLDKWKQDQTINACMSYPYDGDHANAEAVKKYKSMIGMKSKEVALQAAEEGNYLHGCMNRWMESGELPENAIALNMINRMAERVQMYIERHGPVVRVSSEIPVGSKEIGFCGTPDILIDFEDGFRLIADLKTTNFRSYKKPYDSQRSQLGGYSILTQSDPNTTLEQWVADRDTGDMLFFEHENPEQWVRHFSCLFECWCIMKAYDPRTVA